MVVWVDMEVVCCCFRNHITPCIRYNQSPHFSVALKRNFFERTNGFILLIKYVEPIRVDVGTSVTGFAL